MRCSFSLSSSPPLACLLSCAPRVQHDKVREERRRSSDTRAEANTPRLHRSMANAEFPLNW